MPRATYNDLIKEVRAQIAVDDTTAYAWLLDRSRVLNAEASWLWSEGQADPMPPQSDPNGRFWSTDEDTVWVEAVWAGLHPPVTIYHRSTPSALDARWEGRTGNLSPIYADTPALPFGLQIHPPIAPGQSLTYRYVSDVYEDRDSPPPFPVDFDGALVDGAVAMGLARMDERLDSASYMDQRFQGAIGRLRRRRHARVGRGATSIRVVQ